MVRTDVFVILLVISTRGNRREMRAVRDIYERGKKIRLGKTLRVTVVRETAGAQSRGKGRQEISLAVQLSPRPN